MRRYVITGAPGTGKTALVESLSHVGTIVGEPARELIVEHREATGERSLDGSPEMFIDRLIVRSIKKFDAAPDAEAVIYDRGLPDCVAYAQVFGLDPGPAFAAAGARRYSDPVFVAPPWEAIYSVDDMRKATFDQIRVFHDVLVAAYETLDYELVELPQATLAESLKSSRLSCRPPTHSRPLVGETKGNWPPQRRQFSAGEPRARSPGANLVGPLHTSQSSGRIVPGSREHVMRVR